MKENVAWWEFTNLQADIVAGRKKGIPIGTISSNTVISDLVVAGQDGVKSKKEKGFNSDMIIVNMDKVIWL